MLQQTNAPAADRLATIFQTSECIAGLQNVNGFLINGTSENVIDKFKPGTLFVDCSTIDVEKARELHKYYYPKEVDANLDTETRIKFMEEWVNSAHGLFMKYELTN